MSTLTFADTHNMVSFLEKPAESDGFHEIINFLNANQIHYALTFNPTIYTSCIEQLWATAKAKTVNSKCGIDCLPTATIFEKLARMGPQKKQSRRKQRKETEVPQDETHHDDNVPIPSNDLILKKAKDAQAKEIAGLKKRVQKLERKKKSRTTGLKRLRKVGESRRVSSSKDKDSLGAQEDASKQGRIFKGIDKDIEVSLVDETHGRSNEAEMFDTDDLHGDEVIVDMVVGEKQEQRVIDELTLAQTLIEIKAAKPKVVTTAATTTTTTRPKARGVVVQEPSEFKIKTSSPQVSQPSKTKDKGKEIMIEPEVPLKRKDQVALDEEMARNLEAQLQAKLIEEEKMARKKEEEANIALIESWENTQAMMEADRLLAERLQTREQEDLTDKEKAKLFMEFIEKRRKHFAALRAKEKRNRPPTKAQKRNQMSIYIKHMGGYKHNQLNGRSYDEIQKLFDKEMKRVNFFVAMNSEALEISGKKDKSSSKKAEIAQDSSAKRVGDKLESDKSKKQKTDENKEVEVDNEAELKKHMVLVKDDDIAIDAIPLATKPPVIVEYKLIKEGIMGHYQLIRANGSSKRYSSMIRMLQGIDKEDLETLWKLVKTKHGDTRPEDEHERVLWGDLKVMFELDIKSDIWRNLQGYKVTVWKLFDSCGVHFVRFGNVHIFMLVEKRYPLTPITITNMLNKKLQTDYWNEMCYQLLKLMIQKMNIKFRRGLLGLKDFKMILRITTAQLWDEAGNLSNGIKKGKESFICLYVDDMLIFGTDQVQVDLTKDFLSSRFSMKDMGEADVILGIRIKHESNGLSISQSYYIGSTKNSIYLVIKVKYLVSTPMDTNEKLMPNNGQAVSQLEYSRVIGCLMYALTCTRPDIAFARGITVQCIHIILGYSAWQAIQGHEYLKKTMNYKLTYTGYSSVLEGYTDASWISNSEDNSSTSGWVFLLGGAAGKEAEWLRNLILEIPLWSKPIAPISIRCDSAATLAKAYSQMYNGKSRHLGVRHSMIRELITNGVISIEFVRSQQNLVDHLTKGLARDLVIKSAEGMGLMSN
ncbi:zinc finger, CCHC-type containing protein [Tanacetum coccineum]